MNPLKKYLKPQPTKENESLEIFKDFFGMVMLFVLFVVGLFLI